MCFFLGGYIDVLKVVSVERALSMLTFFLSQPMNYSITPYNGITIILKLFVLGRF